MSVVRLVRGIVSACLVAAVWPVAPSHAQAVRPTVFVVPFDSDKGQTTTYWLGEGVALLLVDGLGPQAFEREERVRALDELHLPVTGTLSRATLVRVGRLVGATGLVFGNVTLAAQVLTVRARLLRLDAAQVAPEIVESGPIGEMFEVCGRVASRMARLIGDRPVPMASPPPSLDAFEAYVKGLLAETPEAQERLLASAIRRQPSFDRALVALWDVRMARGDHEAALAAARAVPETSPLARRARLMTALTDIELKRYDAAFQTLKAMADEQPSPDVLNNLGVIQLRRTATPQTGRATYYFSKATEASPDDPDLFFNLGYAYWLERDPPAAIYWLREAVRRDPTDGDAHYVLSVALTSTSATAEAARERELAQRLSPKYDEWHKQGGGVDGVPRGLERLQPPYRLWTEPHADATMLAAAQREQKDLSTFYVDRAQRLIAEQRDSDAVGELRRALFLAPYDAEALYLLGRTYLRLGRTRDAIDALRISIWASERADAHLALAEALLEVKEIDGARTAVQRALVLAPTSEEAQRLLARLDGQPER